MSKDTATSGDRGDKPQSSTSLSERVFARAFFSGVAFALLVGTAHLAVIENSNGKDVHVVADALLALLIYAPLCATAAVLGAAIVTKRWKTTLRCFLPLAASLFLTWTLLQGFLHAVWAPGIIVPAPVVQEQDSTPQK